MVPEASRGNVQGAAKHGCVGARAVPCRSVQTAQRRRAPRGAVRLRHDHFFTHGTRHMRAPTPVHAASMPYRYGVLGESDRAFVHATTALLLAMGQCSRIHTRHSPCTCRSRAFASGTSVLLCSTSPPAAGCWLLAAAAGPRCVQACSAWTRCRSLPTCSVVDTARQARPLPLPRPRPTQRPKRTCNATMPRVLHVCKCVATRGERWMCVCARVCARVFTLCFHNTTPHSGRPCTPRLHAVNPQI